MPAKIILTEHNWIWGYIYWAAWIFGMFLIGELLSKDVLGIAPWGSLSQTTRHAIRTYPFVGSALFGLLIGLGFHLLAGRRLLPSLLFGIVVAVGAHLLDTAWP